MATQFKPNSLLDQWLTIQNQGADLSGSYGDGSGPETEWLKLLQGNNMDGLWDTARTMGYTGNMPVDQSGGGDSAVYQPGDPRQELMDWMRTSGNSYAVNPTFNGGQENAWLDPQGQEVAGTRREFEAPDDSAFWAMANLAGGLVAGPGLAASLGNAGAGAVMGGMAGFGQDMDIKDALKGAALGGLAGYGMEQFAGAPDAMGDYMRTGASEGSTIGNAYTGAGGQAGAVGANSIAAQMAIPSDFDPASLFQNVADPTAALQQLPEIGQVPGPMPGMSPSGLGSIPTGEFAPVGSDITQMLQNLQLPEVPQMPWQPMPYEQTVDVSSGPQTSTMPDTLPPTPAPLDPIPPNGAGTAASVTAGLPSLPAVPAAVGGGLLSSLPAGVTSALQTALPIAGAIAGSQPTGGGTQTTQNRTDPRFDPYLYGDGGFLPSAKAWFDANKSGANDTMRAGWQAQLGLLQDPAIASQLSGMRNQGLLQSQGTVAGNPFTTGQAQLGGAAQGLLGGWNQQPPQQPQQPQGPQAGGPGGQVGLPPMSSDDFGPDPRGSGRPIQYAQQPQQPGANPSGYIPGRDYGGGIVSSGGLGYDPRTGGPMQYTAPTRPGERTFGPGDSVNGWQGAQQPGQVMGPGLLGVPPPAPGGMGFSENTESQADWNERKRIAGVNGDAFDPRPVQLSLMQMKSRRPG